MGQVVAGIAISGLLVAACLFLHFSVLRTTALVLSDPKIRIRRPMITVMTVIFLTHIAEIALFAAAFFTMGKVGLGELSGAYNSSAVDYFYFSIATYSTLGIGDIFPDGAMRMVAGVEALLGLVLIAWSASFTYLMMERLWTGESKRD